MKTGSIDEKKLNEGISLPAVFGAGVTLLKRTVTSPKFWITVGIVLSVVGVLSVCCLAILGPLLGGLICFIIGYAMTLTGVSLTVLGACALREEEQEKERRFLAHSKEFNGNRPNHISVKEKPLEEA
jgi:hypothetical protein